MTAPSEPDRDTELADLQGQTIDDICRANLEPYRRVLMAQVEKPRLNIGSGPPGRAD